MTAFLVNVDGPFGGNLRISLRKETDNYFWDETSTDWIDPDGLGFIFDNSTVAIPGVSGVRGAYQVSFPFTSTWSGKLLLAVHDANNSNEVLHQIKITSRAGDIVEDIVMGLARTNSEVSDSLTFFLSRRQDGTISATRDMYIADGDVDLRFGLQTSGLFVDGVNVATIDSIAVSAAGQLTVSAVGQRDQIAILSVDGGQVAGESYVLTCGLTMSNTEKVKARLTIQCKVT